MSPGRVDEPGAPGGSGNGPGVLIRSPSLHTSSDEESSKTAHDPPVSYDDKEMRGDKYHRPCLLCVLVPILASLGKSRRRWSSVIREVRARALLVFLHLIQFEWPLAAPLPLSHRGIR